MKPLVIVGLICLLIAVLTFFRKNGKKTYDTSIGHYDQEDTIVVKAFIALWRIIPNWVLTTIFGALGILAIVKGR